MQRIIAGWQKAYLPRRFIGKITRGVYDIFNYAKHNDTPGILLLINFLKAFDSISHEYIKNTMKAFNFSDDFISKVATCLHGFKSQTLVNGCLSAAIDLLRGCC